MSAMGKVINDNKFPLIDEFKGRKINLDPGEAIDMDYYDYVEFKGQIPAGIKTRDDMFDGSGNQKPQSFKMVRYDGPLPNQEETEHVCQKCRGKFANAKQLNAHIDEWHLDDIEDQDVAEERRSQSSSRKRRQ